MTERQSQCEELLNYLKANSGIEPITALKKLGIMRLSARIHDLRASGYNIITQMVTHGKRTFAYDRLIKNRVRAESEVLHLTA